MAAPQPLASTSDSDSANRVEAGAAKLKRTESNSYIQFTPKRTMASFENLVALANHQEKLREARKVVWRDRGEIPVELHDLWEVAEHAGRGGFRAGGIAFMMRAAFNVVLALIRIGRIPKKARLRLIYNAIFGKDTWRFGFMLGSFVLLYKSILNGLPLVLPSTRRHSLPLHRGDDDPFADTPPIDADEKPPALDVPTNRRTQRLSLSKHAQQMWVRKKTQRWHAVVAGAIAGGISIMFEHKSRRTTIGQQMFVRGLQGSWNAFSEKRGIRVPHGEIAIFALMSGQILYAWLLRPDTMPRGYTRWVGAAAHVPPECVTMNNDLVRLGTFNPADVQSIIGFDSTSPANRTRLISRLESALAPQPDYGPRFAPCAAVHPTVTDCTHVPLTRFVDVFRWMLPVYGALHFIPTVLFKRKAFMQDPLKMLLRAGWGTARSSSFLGLFVIIYQSLFCLKSNIYTAFTSPDFPIKLPSWFVNFWITKFSFWLPGFASGFAILLEERRRRGELAMYVLPKGLESMWVMARGKGLVFKTGQFSHSLLSAIGMAMVMNTYQNDPQHLSGLVRRILYQFIGAN